MQMGRRMQSVALGVVCFCISGAVQETHAQEPVRLDAAVRSQCLRVLRQSLRSDADDFWPAIHAAEGLTLAGHGGEVIGYLKPKLAGQTDDQKRCGLARELVRAGDLERRRVMLDILAGNNPYGHVHAAESLFKVAQIGDGKSPRKALKRSDNLKLQVMAAAALGRGGDPSAMATLRAILVGDDAEGRQLAAWVLARIGNKQDLPGMRLALQRTDDALQRAYFQHALAALGDPAGRTALLQNLRSKNPMIRTYAATFAGDGRLRGAVPQLIQLLDDPHRDVRIRAAQTLLVLSRTVPKSAHNLQWVRPNHSSGRSAAVRIRGAELVHTTQLLPSADSGPDCSGQIQSVLEQLDALLSHCGARRRDLVKINVYLQDSGHRNLFVREFAAWCGQRACPAVAVVATALPRDTARIALDAVFAGRKSEHAFRPRMRGLPSVGMSFSNRALARSLPPGDAVYVSGQAAAGDLSSATRDTLAELVRTLEHMQLTRRNIVQIKCFLQPMGDVESVDEQIAELFADQQVPPVAHVEWISGSRPIEIELIAWAPHQPSSDSVSYVTPPWMKPSPVFSRVSRIHGDDRLYVSELSLSADGDAGRQMHSLFSKLARLLAEGGSDMRHLAKATYYVADSGASQQLNQIRSTVYDALRPPAASKALVRDVGTSGHAMALDMIAGPLQRGQSTGGSKR